MKNSSTSTWILILIAIGLLVVAWYMSVTKDVLEPTNQTQSIVVREQMPVTSRVESADNGIENAQNAQNIMQTTTLGAEQTPMNAGEGDQTIAEFEGTLPCADCPGIITTLTLYPNQTYQLDTVYIDRDSSFTSKGSWKYETNPQRYVLIDDKQQYQILDDNTLQALDTNGNPIESAANYKLTRVQVTESN